MDLKPYRVKVEVWVKPMFRKARPKVIDVTCCAPSLDELYRMLNKEYEGKRWKLLLVDEITVTTKCSEVRDGNQ